MAVSCSAFFRVSLFLLLTSAIITAFFTLPIEKILNDLLVWTKQNLGSWGPLVLAIAYTVLAVPASVLTLGGGYLFGLPLGFVSDSVGATLGATAAFLLGRTIGRPYVISKLKDYPKFQAVAIAIQRSGFKIVLLLRLVPLLPFNMLNYLLSVTPISIGEYMMASWLGMVPITLALVYVGTTLEDLADATHGWSQVSTTRWECNLSTPERYFHENCLYLGNYHIRFCSICYSYGVGHDSSEDVSGQSSSREPGCGKQHTSIALEPTRTSHSQDQSFNQ